MHWRLFVCLIDLICLTAAVSRAAATAAATNHQASGLLSPHTVVDRGLMWPTERTHAMHACFACAGVSAWRSFTPRFLKTKQTHTHTHTHRKEKREEEREEGKKKGQEIFSSVVYKQTAVATRCLNIKLRDVHSLRQKRQDINEFKNKGLVVLSFYFLLNKNSL